MSEYILTEAEVDGAGSDEKHDDSVSSADPSSDSSSEDDEELYNVEEIKRLYSEYERNRDKTYFEFVKKDLKRKRVEKKKK